MTTPHRRLLSLVGSLYLLFSLTDLLPSTPDHLCKSTWDPKAYRVQIAQSNLLNDAAYLLSVFVIPIRVIAAHLVIISASVVFLSLSL